MATARTLFPALLLSTLFAACSGEHTGKAGDQQPSDAAQPDPGNVVSKPVQRCFLNVTRSADGSTVDSMRVSLTLTGYQVTGRMDWLPGAKDRMTGTLDGVRKGDLLYVIHHYTAEGTSTMEQRVLRLGAHDVAEVNGETVQNEQGWELKDPATATELWHAPEVDCP